MRTTSRRNPGRLVLIVAVALLIGMVLLMRGPLGGLAWKILSPISSLRDAVFSSSATALRAELASTSAALADRDALYKENQELRGELGRKGERREVAASIIGRPPATPYDTLMLDAGTVHGVKLGARVYAHGAALGVIDTVWSTSSRAVLYSSAGQIHEATIATQKAAVPVSLEGQGGGSMRGQVPSGTDVLVDDTISLPGVLGGISAKVAAVDAGVGESFKTVYARLPFNPLELGFVYIEI